MSAMSRSLRSAKLGVIALVLLMLAVAWYFGALSHVAEPRALAQTLVQMGGWGHVAFLVAYSVLQPFGVPGTIFVVAAPLIWPWQTAWPSRRRTGRGGWSSPGAAGCSPTPWSAT